MIWDLDTRVSLLALSKSYRFFRWTFVSKNTNFCLLVSIVNLILFSQIGNRLITLKNHHELLTGCDRYKLIARGFELPNRIKSVGFE